MQAVKWEKAARLSLSLINVNDMMNNAKSREPLIKSRPSD